MTGRPLKKLNPRHNVNCPDCGEIKPRYLSNSSLCRECKKARNEKDRFLNEPRKGSFALVELMGRNPRYLHYLTLSWSQIYGEEADPKPSVPQSSLGNQGCTAQQETTPSDHHGSPARVDPVEPL